MTTRWLWLWMTALVVVSGCKKEPDRWEEAAQRIEQAPPAAPVELKVEGGALNAFFPRQGLVFTAEKPGYVEATLTVGESEAMLAVSQVAPDAVSKFETATDSVVGHPLVTVGKNQSALLVDRRFQVKVSSQTLGPAERKQILQSFDLAGLAAFTQ